MAWDFETEPEFEAKLAWMRQFVREEIIPLETLADRWRSAQGRAIFKQITDPLKDEVRRIFRRLRAREQSRRCDHRSYR